MENVDEEATDHLNAESSRLLLAFSNLRKLAIAADSHVDLNDDSVRDLVMALPHLRELTLVSLSDRPPSPTFHALVHLVRYCPQLTQLMLDVDTENTDNIARTPPPGDPGKIAAFLSDLPPNLREIDDSGWTPEVEEAWKHVDELLPTFAAVRAQERSSLHLEAEPKGGLISPPPILLGVSYSLPCDSSPLF
ncbi:hypothetical protein BKA93DRAFT_823208 [Sparassis latifolia]